MSKMYTTQQLREAVIQGDLGEPITISSKRSQNLIPGLTGEEVLSTQRGQVALLTTICAQVGNSKVGVLTAYNPSPTNALYGGSAVNEDSEGWAAFRFLQFRRPETHFMGSSTPTARSAPPGNVVVWPLKYPVPVPSGCDIIADNSLGDFGNHLSVDAVLVDAGVAASLGFNVNPDPDTSRCRLFTGLATSVAAELIPGRARQHIRLKDIYIRMQAASATANVLRIYQKSDDEEAVETDIFRFVNNNVVDAIDVKFSPDEIFLAAGHELWIETTVANSATVAISMQYDDPDQCDANAFFACANPIKPGTTSGTSVATIIAGAARKVGVAISLYYPKQMTTATLPGSGKQHLVRGVAISVQKGNGRFAASVASRVTDQTLFTISQGPTAGEIGLTALVPTEDQPNQQLIPVLYATEHDQNVLFVDDQKNAACTPNDGGLWVNALNLANTGDAGGAGGSVATTDADISAWSFMLWGRTIPTRFRTPQLRDSA